MSNRFDRVELIDLLATVLECPKTQLDLLEKTSDLPNWDSMAMISLIATVDEKYGKTLRGKDLQDASTIEQLLNLIVNE